MCTALELGGDVEQPWLMSKYDVIRKTGTTVIDNTHKKFNEDHTCSSEVMIVDRQTHTHTHRERERERERETDTHADRQTRPLQYSVPVSAAE